MCGYECFISSKIVHSSLLSWRDRSYKKAQGSKPKFSKKKVWGKYNLIYEIYKNTVMPHGRHIYAKISDMEKSTMCEYPHSYHELPHWKRFIRCCAKFPSVNIPYQETDDQYSNTSPSINFHIYHIIARFT